MASRKMPSAVIVFLVVVIVLLAYRQANRPNNKSSAKPIGTPIAIKAPLGLPPVPIPADNPPTVETVALGRRLYYDPILSADGTASCASCHSPEAGFANPKRVSQGVQHKTGIRNSPPVLNSAYFVVQFWDGRAPSLEKQAEGPVQNPVEMANTLEVVEQRLNADAGYREQFAAAFGSGPITYDMAEKAIASFERTVLVGNSPFDRWKYGHDENAVSESVKRGFVVFTSPARGNCAACHTVGEEYALLTDNKFHNVGVGVKNEQVTDPGRFNVTNKESDRGLFKTPSLRNIAVTAPYMHDGSLQDLKQVVDFYVGAGNSNPNLDKEVHVLDFLSGQERTDLRAFLESLTGEVPADVGPPQAPMSQARR